jgi:tRNA threonylcarbamoyladenosine modification (KEOPS) complex Cgi121 subunit
MHAQIPERDSRGREVLSYIEEFKTHLAINGFRGTRIENTETFLKAISTEKPTDTEAQFFDANLVATWQHLYFAVLNALTTFKNEHNISRSLAMETILYASAQGQISKATELIGIKPESTEIATVIIAKKPEDLNLTFSMIIRHINARQDDRVLELSPQKDKAIRKNFKISDTEIKTVMKGHDAEKALVDLVIERMALLATQR